MPDKTQPSENNCEPVELEDPPENNSKIKLPPEKEVTPIYVTPSYLLLKKYDSPFVNKVINRNVVSGEVQIKYPEFSNIYPGDADINYALLHINYLPRHYCVSEKSLSEYLKTFCKYMATHDTCITIISNDLINLLDPFQITVTAESVHVGGVHFRPTVQYVRK